MSVELEHRAELADQLVPIAARLVGAVHDDGPTAVQQLLARVPDGRFDALAVVLAAMVDPDRTPRELLAWTAPDPIPGEQEFASLLAAGVEPLRASHIADAIARVKAA